MLFKIFADPSSLNGSTSPVMWHVHDTTTLASGFPALCRVMQLPNSCDMINFELRKFRGDGSVGDPIGWTLTAGSVVLLPGDMIYLRRVARADVESIMDGRPRDLTRSMNVTESVAQSVAHIPNLADDDPITITVTPAPWYSLLDRQQDNAAPIIGQRTPTSSSSIITSPTMAPPLLQQQQQQQQSNTMSQQRSG
eukprot:PhF_6_TR41336/c1_g2_i1/m.62703